MDREDDNRYAHLFDLGDEFEFKYAVAKNIILGVDYYDSEQDAPGLDDDGEKVLQTDILFKF